MRISDWSSDVCSSDLGSGEVDHHVLHAGLQPRGAAAVQHEAVGGNQQHLEEDEEVEDVAGQKGAVDAHELELEEGVEVAPAVVPAADRKSTRLNSSH